MDIDTPLRELGPVDSGPLVEAILAQETAAWREELHRQESYDVHRDTESIVMVFTESRGLAKHHDQEGARLGPPREGCGAGDARHHRPVLPEGR